jgi:hypothetical protein
VVSQNTHDRVTKSEPDGRREKLAVGIAPRAFHRHAAASRQIQMREYRLVCSSSETDIFSVAYWWACSKAHVQLTSAPVASMRLFEAYSYRNSRPSSNSCRRRVGKSPDGRMQAGLTRPHTHLGVVLLELDAGARIPISTVGSPLGRGKRRVTQHGQDVGCDV